MSEQEWPTLGYSVKGNRYEIKATRGEIYEAYMDDQIIELVDRRALAAKDARIAELCELLRDSAEAMKHGDFSNGVCCCGSYVDSHGMGDGHSPVDSGDYYASGLIERIDEALSSQQQAEPSDPFNTNACTHPDCGRFYDEGTKGMACRAWRENACAAPATPSEDGGEVPEVVGHLLLGGYADQVELEDNDIELDMKIVERLQADQLLINGDGVQLPLMTVAQHSRILAAKDAEIARLKADDAEAIKRPPYAHICIGMPAALHHDTRKLLERFTHALAVKLRAAEQKYGYSNGWKDAGWMDECRAKLAEHMAKGDPRDVAAYCAFLWHHGESTSQSGEPIRSIPNSVRRFIESQDMCSDCCLDETCCRPLLRQAKLDISAQPASQPVEDGLGVVSGVVGALRHVLNNLDSETLEDIDYQQVSCALHVYDLFGDHPARQVGGGEPESAAEKYFGSTKLVGPYAATVEGGVVRRYFMDFCEACDAVEMAHVLVCMGCDSRQRAALAPAAVVIPPYADLDDHPVADIEYQRDVGWNMALAKVARLNRRAIPEGLIEASRRAADILGSQGFAAWDQLAAELRALLGKEGE